MATRTTFINDVSVTTTIRPVDCASCGLTFGLSTEFEGRRRNDHRDFYCPNGHVLAFNGLSEAERERDAARSLAKRESQRRVWAEEAAERERRSAIAHKGWATRIRNRIKNGVCPCCNRSFENVRRHISTQHPDFQVPEAS